MCGVCVCATRSERERERQEKGGKSEETCKEKKCPRYILYAKYIKKSSLESLRGHAGGWEWTGAEGWVCGVRDGDVWERMEGCGPGRGGKGRHGVYGQRWQLEPANGKGGSKRTMNTCKLLKSNCTR